MPGRRPAPIRDAATRRTKADLPVDVFLEGYSPNHRAIANHLRALIQRTIPGTTERVRVGWRVIGFDLPNRRRGAFYAWVFPEREHVHLGFPQGHLIADPSGQLDGEGITKRARWLTYTSVEEVDEDLARTLLLAAAGIADLPPDAFGS